MDTPGIERLIRRLREAAVVVETPGGRIRAWNAAAQTLFGYTPTEARALTLDALMTESLRPALRAALAGYAFGEPAPMIDAPEPVEATACSKTGAEIAIELSLSPVDDTGGEHPFVLALIRDIRSRRRREDEARREGEARLRLALRAAGMGTWDWDIANGTITWSGAVEALHGMDAGTFDGRFETWIARIYPEDRERVTAAIDHALQGGEAYDVEFRVVWGDGSLHWLSTQGQVFRESSRTPGRMLGATWDVTARKRAEGELRASEDRLNAILQSAADGITVQDTDGRLLYANTAAARLIGFPSAEAVLATPREQIMGRFRVVDEAGASVTPLELPAVVAARTGRPAEAVVRFEVLATGEERWSNVRAVPVLDDHGAVRFAVTAFQDITPLKQATAERERLLAREQAARAAAERAANRIRRLQDITAALAGALTPEQVMGIITEQGIAALDAYAGGVGLLTDGGATIEVVRAIGYPREISARYASYPVTADNPPAEAVRTGAPVWVESAADETARFPRHAAAAATGGGSGAIAAVPLHDGGAVIGVLAFSFRGPRHFDDEDRTFVLALTHQCAQALGRARLYEAERRARAEAEAANRAKDEFLTVLSHELRTPLTPILGFAGLLRRRAVPSPDLLARAVDAIERGARAQSRLVDDLLDVSRIVTGRLELTMAPVDMPAVVEAAVETARPFAEERGVTLKTKLSPDTSSVLGDTGRLQQVVWNLVANAIKFTPAGGRVEVRLERHGSDATITVADTGIGIAPEFVSHVFDRFSQADASNARSYGGLGLGLAIVRHLVERHGGTVAAASAGEGQGATFTVRLPLAGDEP